MFGTAKSSDKATWLALALAAIAVLLPTGALLWFVSQAAQQQVQAAQERTSLAYESQLRILQTQIENQWRNLLLKAASAAGDGAPANFVAALKASRADTVLFLDNRGALRYPAPPGASGDNSPFEAEPWLSAEALEKRPDQSAAIAVYNNLTGSAATPKTRARAAEGLVRCLVRSGRKKEARAVIEKYFTSGPASRVNDFDGRWIAGDEQLFGLRLMDRGDSSFPRAAERLKGMLDDYAQYAVPSAQRIFLGDELRELALPWAPATDAAERLAQQVLEKAAYKAVAPGQLLRSPIAGLWNLATPDMRVVAVYRTDTLIGILHGMLKSQNVPNVVEFYAVRPGEAAQSGAAQVLTDLPGWRITYTLRDSNQAPVNVVPAHRIAQYLWAAYLIIACAVLAGVALVHTIRRQMRLARMKTDLAATVSHELKTPLASTRLLVESLLEDTGLPPETSREYLELIAGENLRLTRLVENFLTFSRIERKRQRFEFAEVRPGELIQDAVTSLRERVQAKQCRLDVDVSPGLPPIRADRDALITVLLNLLDNAVKYAPLDTHIKVRAYLEADHVVLSVEDNGIGIAPREQKRIFRRFYQVDQRLARENGGCGLGLSIVDYIVRAHDGEVAVCSSPGEGSTFRVLLPFATAPEEVPV
jgi:signal transduction histidine kinase